jgi:hypothetical protein
LGAVITDSNFSSDRVEPSILLMSCLGSLYREDCVASRDTREIVTAILLNLVVFTGYSRDTDPFVINSVPAGSCNVSVFVIALIILI